MILVREVSSMDDLRDQTKVDVEVPRIARTNPNAANDARRTFDKQRREAQGFLDELEAFPEEVNRCHRDEDDLYWNAATKAQKEKPKAQMVIVPKRRVA